jgi:hypothetical protein
MLEDQLELEQTRFAQFRSPGMGGREFRRVRAVVPDRSVSPARIITYGLYEVRRCWALLGQVDGVAAAKVAVPDGACVWPSVGLAHAFARASPLP